jgi:hypothetical protein
VFTDKECAEKAAAELGNFAKDHNGVHADK